MMTRWAFLKRMTLAAAACAFFDVALPKRLAQSEPVPVEAGSFLVRAYTTAVLFKHEHGEWPTECRMSPETMLRLSEEWAGFRPTMVVGNMQLSMDDTIPFGKMVAS